MNSLLSELLVPDYRVHNMSTIALASNPVFHACAKHIKIDLHFVREKVLKNTPAVQYVPSCDQKADMFTKPLPLARFVYLKDKLMVHSSP